MYVAALVAYDGTTFNGFQIQRSEPTVQGALEAGLYSCCREHVRVHGSGRTDTGVHANGQVVAAEVPWRHSVGDLQRAWNAYLPSAVTVRDLVEAPSLFHPRFSAESRIYRYTVYDIGGSDAQRNVPSLIRTLPKSSPLTDRFSIYLPLVLNLEAMQEATRRLVGEHDFATFGRPPQGENTVRTIYEADWQEVVSNLSAFNDYPGRCLVFTIRANAFLQHMVRNIVGTLLVVGKQLWPAASIDELLEARDRSRCAAPAPPQGLVLEHVIYPTEVDPWSVTLV